MLVGEESRELEDHQEGGVFIDFINIWRSNNNNVIINKRLYKKVLQ